MGSRNSLTSRSSSFHHPHLRLNLILFCVLKILGTCLIRSVQPFDLVSTILSQTPNLPGKLGPGTPSPSLKSLFTPELLQQMVSAKVKAGVLPQPPSLENVRRNPQELQRFLSKLKPIHNGRFDPQVLEFFSSSFVGTTPRPSLHHHSIIPGQFLMGQEKGLSGSNVGGFTKRGLLSRTSRVTRPIISDNNISYFRRGGGGAEGSMIPQKFSSRFRSEIQTSPMTPDPDPSSPPGSTESTLPYGGDPNLRNHRLWKFDRYLNGSVSMEDTEVKGHPITVNKSSPTPRPTFIPLMSSESTEESGTRIGTATSDWIPKHGHSLEQRQGQIRDTTEEYLEQRPRPREPLRQSSMEDLDGGSGQTESQFRPSPEYTLQQTQLEPQASSLPPPKYYIPTQDFYTSTIPQHPRVTTARYPHNLINTGKIPATVLQAQFDHLPQATSFHSPAIMLKEDRILGLGPMMALKPPGSPQGQGHYHTRPMGHFTGLGLRNKYLYPHPFRAPQQPQNLKPLRSYPVNPNFGENQHPFANYDPNYTDYPPDPSTDKVDPGSSSVWNSSTFLILGGIVALSAAAAFLVPSLLLGSGVAVGKEDSSSSEFWREVRALYNDLVHLASGDLNHFHHMDRDNDTHNGLETTALSDPMSSDDVATTVRPEGEEEQIQSNPDPDNDLEDEVGEGNISLITRTGTTLLPRPTPGPPPFQRPLNKRKSMRVKHLMDDDNNRSIISPHNLRGHQDQRISSGTYFTGGGGFGNQSSFLNEWAKVQLQMLEQ